MPRENPWRVAFAVVAALVLAAGAWYGWSAWSKEPLPPEIPADAFRDVSERFRRRYGRAPTRLDTLSMLGEIAIQKGRLETALACFREIPDDHPKYGMSARLQQAQVLYQLNRAVEAEDNFREFLKRAKTAEKVPLDQVAAAFQWLVFLDSVELRFEDRRELLAAMHEMGIAGIWESKLYYFPHLLIWSAPEGSKRVRDFLQEDPEDLRLQLAAARYLTTEGRLDEAQRRLEELWKTHPENLACAAALLECHFERNDWKQFAKVAEQLPPPQENEPWLMLRMRGEFALHTGDWEGAIRNFQRLIEADPTNPSANMGLAEAYGKLGRKAEREKRLKDALILADIRVGLRKVTETDPAACRDLASKCEELGLAEAAATFRQHAGRVEQNTTHQEN